MFRKDIEDPKRRAVRVRTQEEEAEGETVWDPHDQAALWPQEAPESQGGDLQVQRTEQGLLKPKNLHFFYVF